ncbi:cis-aconitate decarboxylase [Acipenser oxyrinchus oxyrinchus]|uniref:Cis-aconitate decarboxylase n=1 Tax=Acipenser oxyrinchus oxyrinchus TaxID=40147 RepID=A0AAD8LM45_ACIOX|nr:cis-aconitate decarboxylase [Acipenser oxyrinchus oxyrinchus]
MLRKTVTESFGATIEGLKASHLTETVVERSKRMILDTLGVGLLGTNTSVFKKILQYSKVYNARKASTVWGNSNISLLPQYAAFVNGVAVHSMDFDDTWYPATHPSGAVLPAVLALAEVLPQQSKPSGMDLLLAFNVGIEVQGRLMRFSKEASNIPKRFHPPAVVGTMGSAAATSKLLHMGSAQCREVLAIAASYSGAPMANAATQTKPLHIGNAARRGLEASYLALLGLEGNKNILDMKSGFGAFYTDYTPDMLAGLDSYRWVLEDQDVAIKRFPAHLGMHWVADAATALRMKLLEKNLPLVKIKKVVLKVPDARYVNRPFPASEHEARHSFQFNACTALVDGSISEESFSDLNLHRQEIRDLLQKVLIENPHDNHSNFDTMYCEVGVEMHTGETITERCNTFYGHWREPLSQYDLLKKFKANASTVLSMEAVQGIIDTVANLEKVTDCTVLSSYLQVKEKPI